MKEPLEPASAVSERINLVGKMSTSVVSFV